EGVEDIPGAALAEGMQWEWESFPEYLDALDRRRFAVDVSALVAHGPVRAYVMGERGARNEPATPAEIDRMAQIVAEAVRAGAKGFSTSRTIAHRAMDGEPVPGTFAAEDELFALARAVDSTGKGLVEVAPAGVAGEDIVAPEREMEWMLRLSKQISRPITWLMLQNLAAPDDWRQFMSLSAQAQSEGHLVIPQVAGRPFGVLFGLQGRHRFRDCPSFAPLLALDHRAQAAAMRSGELRAALIAEAARMEAAAIADNPVAALMLRAFDRLYVLGDPVDYEPTQADSIAARAAARGVDPADEYYDRLLDRDGSAFMLMTFLGYSHGNGDALYEMLNHPAAVLGLADGGAHSNFICDASTPTWMLTHWARDRTRGPRLELPYAVKKMTSDTARLFDFHDRGIVAPGMKADLNVIDFDALRLHEPKLVHDLPAGGSRLVQPASGYAATIVSGVVSRADDEFTGELPGRLVRS
ncbi:MAG: amidohydrolase family protein, partial [Acidimicrobiales bacterium]|nr:amidohydrolase family protein [Acidimicrobiales bacterium]